MKDQDAEKYYDISFSVQFIKREGNNCGVWRHGACSATRRRQTSAGYWVDTECMVIYGQMSVHLFLCYTGKYFELHSFVLSHMDRLATATYVSCSIGWLPSSSQHVDLLLFLQPDVCRLLSVWHGIITAFNQVWPEINSLRYVYVTYCSLIRLGYHALVLKLLSVFSQQRPEHNFPTSHSHTYCSSHTLFPQVVPTPCSHT